MRGNRDVGDEQLGAYSFNLNRAAAVERSLGRIRHKLSGDWVKLQADEIQSLEWALGEAWAVMDFQDWDRVDLAAIDLETADRLIELGRQGRARRLPGPKAALAATEILRGL